MSNNRINAHAVWAADAEIGGAACLLNTPIVIHTEEDKRVQEAGCHMTHCVWLPS